jgi:hypothetical protein
VLNFASNHKSNTSSNHLTIKSVQVTPSSKKTQNPNFRTAEEEEAQ